MTYDEFQAIAYQINNYNSNEIISRIGDEMGYDNGYIEDLIERFYSNPIGFMCNHDIGRRLWEEIYEKAKDNYLRLYKCRKCGHISRGNDGFDECEACGPHNHGFRQVKTYVIRGYPITRFNGMMCRTVEPVSPGDRALVKLELSVPKAGGHEDDQMLVPKANLERV